MVCAIARSAPIKAYFELDAQPEPRMQYTARLDKARINRILRLISAVACGRGMGAQRVSAKVRASMGAARNRILLEVRGLMGSLIKSLTPSAIG